MCRMPERVGESELPAVVTVDLRDRKSRSKGAISPRLAAGIPVGTELRRAGHAASQPAGVLQLIFSASHVAMRCIVRNAI